MLYKMVVCPSHSALQQVWLCCFLFRHVVGLGGNSYCLAGTGKSESVKALGDLFGQQVLVFSSRVVFSYVISQSDLEHDNLYCSNLKQHYLYCLCVSSYTSSILQHCHVLVSSNCPTTLGPGHQAHGSHLHWSDPVRCLGLL